MEKSKYVSWHQFVGTNLGEGKKVNRYGGTDFITEKKEKG